MPYVVPLRRVKSRDEPVLKAENLNILIVEDEAIIALDLEHMFSCRGAQVTLAHSLEEGFKKADTTFDVALLDVRLRNVEVFPLAAKLHSKDVPIVFHSAHITEADIAEDFEGARVVSKPTREDELIDTVLQAAA